MAYYTWVSFNLGYDTFLVFRCSQKIEKFFFFFSSILQKSHCITTCPWSHVYGTGLQLYIHSGDKIKLELFWFSCKTKNKQTDRQKIWLSKFSHRSFCWKPKSLYSSAGFINTDHSKRFLYTWNRQSETSFLRNVGPKKSKWEFGTGLLCYFIL